MSDLRYFGLVISILIVTYGFWQRRHGLYSRGELLLSLLVAVSLAGVSIHPPVVDALTRFFQVPTRLMALAILGNVVLFCLVLVLFRQAAEARRSVSDLVRALARAEYGRERQTHSAPADHPRPMPIVVVIPAYDEAKSLDSLLPRCPTEIFGRPVRVIVVADGARDQSAAVARRWAVPVTSHPINRGQGDALRTGFELALHEDAEIVVTMDADGQHRPEEIERLVAPIVHDQADFVLGARMDADYADRGSFRHAGIVLFSAIASLLGRHRITDCTNGFRAIRASILERLDLRESRFSAPELLIGALSAGCRVIEVPVSVLARASGESKKPRNWRYPIGFGWVMLRTWLRL